MAIGIKKQKKQAKTENKPNQECFSMLETELSNDELNQLARAIKVLKKNPIEWAFLSNYIKKY